MKIRALKIGNLHFLKAGLVLALTLPILGQSIVDANARSSKCKILENNLRRGYELVGQDKVGRQGRALTRAVKTQSQQIKQARQNFRAIGCRLDSEGFLRAGSPRDCTYLGRNISRMKINLRGLKDELKFYASQKVRVVVNPTYTRRQMEKAGCFAKADNRINTKHKSKPLPQRKRISRIPIPTDRPIDRLVAKNSNIDNLQIASSVPTADLPVVPSAIPAPVIKKDITQNTLPKLKTPKKADVTTSTPPIKAKTPLEKIDVKPTPVTKASKPSKNEDVQLSLNKDTYRTMCVRTCDGYYFEVSKSTLKSQFNKDQKTCATACPASPTELFFHRVPDGEIKNMTSAKSGIPYNMQSYAYRFRDGQRKTCTCKQQSANEQETIKKAG